MLNLIGQTIKHYHITEQLGEGGMATVYKAYDTRLERDVAIKIIRRTAFPPEALDRVLTRFDREAKIMASLSHPNIVKLYDFGVYKHSPYMVMEYIPAGTLKNFMGKPVPWKDAVRIVVPLAKALSFAHQKSLIHRDVKPANILITVSGQPILSDFGIAKVLEADESHTLTATGVGIGTPAYMSPEQGLGQKNIDGRTDIYSLGIVLFELITGRKPYIADTPEAVVNKQINDPLPNPSLFVHGLPDQIEKVLIKALQKNPDYRFQDMQAFSTALEKSIDETPIIIPEQEKVTDQISITQSTIDTQITFDSESEPPLDLLRKPQNKKRSWAIILVAIGFMMTIIAIIALIINPTDPSPEVMFPIVPITLTAETDTIKPTPTQQTSTSTPTIDEGSGTVSHTDGMQMVFIPAGDFTMGASTQDNIYGDEGPEHTVYLDAYWIDQTEVTNAMFQQFVNASGYITEIEQAGESAIWNGSGWTIIAGITWQHPFGPSSNLTGRGNYPVIQISWADAQAYCNWAGRRLPTEAEWEKAARGPYGNLYPWGNSQPNPNIANYGSNYSDIFPVGSFPDGASYYGVLDLGGNVYEWVQDWYQRGYDGLPSTNPIGPVSGSYVVMRGGSWELDGDRLSGYRREVSQPGYGNDNVGFRCASSYAP